MTKDNQKPADDHIRALVEALDDSHCTLAAIRAMTVSDDWGEQSTSEHIHDSCGINMRANMTALAAAKDYLND